MRGFIVTVLCTAILSVTVTDSFFYVHYLLNKEYIAKYLCENQERPSMHCEGKCQLAKKLSNAEAALKMPFEAPSNEAETEFFWIFQSIDNLSTSFDDTNKRQSLPYLASHSEGAVHEMFHPPQFVS